MAENSANGIGRPGAVNASITRPMASTASNSRGEAGVTKGFHGERVHAA